MRDNVVITRQADAAYRTISADKGYPILIRAAYSRLGMNCSIVSLAVSS